MNFEEANARNVDDLTKMYLALRDHIKAQQATLDETMKPFKVQMDILEAALQKKVQDTGGTSIKTPHGTPYLSTRTTAKVENKEDFLAFVEEVQDPDLMDVKANKDKVLEYEAQTGRPVPGITMTSVQTLNVRS